MVNGIGVAGRVVIGRWLVVELLTTRASLPNSPSVWVGGNWMTSSTSEGAMHNDYIIQGIMSGVLICEEFSVSEEATARTEAQKMLNRLDFEGDSVRIITCDGELVWESTRGTN